LGEKECALEVEGKRGGVAGVRWVVLGGNYRCT
jgi:hypothetical protein